MLESIETLLRIQDMDISIFRKVDRCNEIPIERERLAANSDELEAEMAAKKNDLKERKVRLHEMEMEIEELKEKAKKFQEQQSLVKKNEEYSALTREIHRVKEECSDQETEAIELMESNEQIEVEIAAFQSQLAARKRDIESHTSELKTEFDELENLIAEEKKARDEVAAFVDRRLLRKYEQLLDRKNKAEVVAIRNGACGCCFALIPLQVIANIKKAKEIGLCENCGSILFFDDRASSKVTTS